MTMYIIFHLNFVMNNRLIGKNFFTIHCRKVDTVQRLCDSTDYYKEKETKKK